MRLLSPCVTSFSRLRDCIDNLTRFTPCVWRVIFYNIHAPFCQPEKISPFRLQYIYSTYNLLYLFFQITNYCFTTGMILHIVFALDTKRLEYSGLWTSQQISWGKNTHKALSLANPTSGNILRFFFFSFFVVTHQMIYFPYCILHIVIVSM